MLSMPIEKPHIMLAFEMPVAARDIRLSGSALKTAELFVNTLDPEAGFDSGAVKALGVRQGQALHWTHPEGLHLEQTTALRITLALDAKRYQAGETTLTLNIDFSSPSVRL